MRGVRGDNRGLQRCTYTEVEDLRDWARCSGEVELLRQPQRLAQVTRRHSWFAHIPS